MSADVLGDADANSIADGFFQFLLALRESR